MIIPNSDIVSCKLSAPSPTVASPSRPATLATLGTPIPFPPIRTARKPFIVITASCCHTYATQNRSSFPSVHRERSRTTEQSSHPVGARAYSTACEYVDVGNETTKRQKLRFHGVSYREVEQTQGEEGRGKRLGVERVEPDEGRERVGVALKERRRGICVEREEGTSSETGSCEEGVVRVLLRSERAADLHIGTRVSIMSSKS